MLFSILKHYFDLYITDTSLKVSRSLYGFTTFISYGVENYSPGCEVWTSLMLFFYFLVLCCRINHLYQLGKNLTPQEIYISISFGHYPVKSVAVPTVSVSVFRILYLIAL